MKNNIIIVSLFAAVFIIVAVVMNTSSLSSSQTIQTQGQNTEIKNGVQYITIDAGGGYLPKHSIAKAGIPTKLIVRTKGNYDCSSSLSIRAVGYQGILPGTGDTEIDLGAISAGEKIVGVCSMGMYSFDISFS